MGWDKLRRRVAFAGLQQGAPRLDVETSTSAKTLAARESGKVFVATKASATQTITLPAPTSEGLVYTIVCGHASGEVLINPGSGYQIAMQSGAGASVKPAAGTGVKNTAATNILNDFVTLVADGTATWHTTGQLGIWASQ